MSPINLSPISSGSSSEGMSPPTKVPPKAGGGTARGTAKDQLWTEYKETIRRLYMDEGKTLKEIIDVMEMQHNFKASPKMYKQRLRRWGFRKNIRVLEAEDEIDCYALENVGEDTTSNGAPPVVQLASGQVVNLDRLANHLRRKMMYRRSVQNVLVPCSIKPPERYYVCEAVLDNTRAYLRGRHEEAFKFVEEIDTIHVGAPASQQWNRFFYRCRLALEDPALFNRALLLMRQAPDELRQLLAGEPPNVLSLFFKFIVYVSRCLQGLTDRAEKKQFSIVVRALIRYAASILAPGTSSSSSSSVIEGGGGSSHRRSVRHPLGMMLRTLVRVDDDQLHPLALKAWKMSCQTWDEIVSATLSTLQNTGEGGDAAEQQLRARIGPSSTLGDWLNFQLIAPESESSVEIEAKINSKLTGMHQAYGGEIIRQGVLGGWLDLMTGAAESESESSSAESEANIKGGAYAVQQFFGEEISQLASLIWSTAVTNGEAARIHELMSRPVQDGTEERQVRAIMEDSMYRKYKNIAFRKNVPPFVMFKSVTEAKQAFRRLGDGEEFWAAHGDFERAEAVGTWVGELMGDLW